MNRVICVCGYKGEQMIEFETTTPFKRLVEWKSGGSYYNFVSWVKQGTKTLNWACPQCGKILVQQRGGLSYNQPELAGMKHRLRHNSYRIEDLNKCQNCGKPIMPSQEWIKSGAYGTPTEYYHESCIKETNKE